MGSCDAAKRIRRNRPRVRPDPTMRVLALRLLDSHPPPFLRNRNQLARLRSHRRVRRSRT